MFGRNAISKESDSSERVWKRVDAIEYEGWDHTKRNGEFRKLVHDRESFKLKGKLCSCGSNDRKIKRTPSVLKKEKEKKKSIDQKKKLSGVLFLDGHFFRGLNSRF